MGKGGRKLVEHQDGKTIQSESSERKLTQNDIYSRVAAAAESSSTFQYPDNGSAHSHLSHPWPKGSSSVSHINHIRHQSFGKRPWPASYKKRSSIASSQSAKSTSLKKAIRGYLLPRIRHETPSLVRFQSKYTSPFNDFFFTYIGAFGTHTAYMLLLPMIFFADADVGGVNRHHYGRGLVVILALGVYVTGLIKVSWLIVLAQGRTSKGMHIMIRTGCAYQDHHHHL